MNDRSSSAQAVGKAKGKKYSETITGVSWVPPKLVSTAESEWLSMGLRNKSDAQLVNVRLQWKSPQEWGISEDNLGEVLPTLNFPPTG